MPTRHRLTPPNPRSFCFPYSILALILGSALLVSPGLASTVTQGSTPGERVYGEDFSDPATVDTGAGAGPGLDQTEINGLEQLVQITGGDGTFVDDFNSAAGFTFDPGRIFVAGGLAQLGDALFPDLLGYWRMEEGGWSGVAGEALDSSGNGFDGLALGDATTAAGGLIGRAGTFDGSGDGLSIGQPAALDLDPTTQEFSLSAWFRTSTQGAILGKAGDDFLQRQYYLFTIDGRVWAAVGGNQNFSSTTGLNDGGWHHAALVNFDDMGVMRYALYVDGVLQGIFDSGTATNTADLLIGARRTVGNTGLGFLMNGQVDEAMILGRALTAQEVAGLYNGGAGRVVEEFPSDAPSISPTAGHTAAGVTDFTAFRQFLGPGNQGSVEYQLSTDGVAWRYWNGAAWVPAGSTDHNPAATVDAQIALFDASAESIYVRAFLLSDGTQRVELDRVEVDFARNLTGAFTIPYDVPGNYVFDPAKIRVEGSLAKLDAEPDLFNDLLGYWRMEEASWNGTPGEVFDGSSLGHHGTAVGNATTFSPGKLGRAGTFDGDGDGIIVPETAELDLLPSQDFTLAAWFRTTTQGAIAGKAVGNFAERQYYLFTTAGQLWGVVGGAQNFGMATGLDDGGWHFGALVNTELAGERRYVLYVDGAPDGTFDAGLATNTADFLIGARRVSGNTGIGFPMDGDIDEVMLFDRALSAAEILQLYNAGSGLVRTFPADAPPVEKTTGDADASLVAFTNFLETPGPGHQGALGYQLSDDGATYRFWNGASWAVVGGPADRNDAVTIDAQIASFPAGGQQIHVRAFLDSDGSQGVELDTVTVRYDTDIGFGAAEVLGPITAGFQFLEFQANVSAEDADHQVLFRFLQADGTTLVSDAVLPGNSTGFGSAAAAAGIDLTALAAGSIHVEVRFTNAMGDGNSAALDDFTLTYLDFNDDSDLSVSKTAFPDPVVAGDEATFEMLVSNAGPSVGFDATLTDPLPPGLLFVSLASPPDWSCTTPAVGSGGVVTCTHPMMPLGGPVLFRLVAEVPPGYAGPDPLTNTATVSAAKDSDPADNSDSASLDVIPSALGSITITKDATPALGTDFDFTGDLGPFTLDDAAPDDGDLVPGSLTFPGLVPGSYAITETATGGWNLLGIDCTSSGISSTFQTPFNDPNLYTFASNKVQVTGGVARLRPDTIGPNLRGYWRMEEAGWNGTPGEVLDTSGNDLHGTATGSATTIAGGQIGRGGTFDAVGDAVNVGQPPELDLDPAVDEFTLATWYRTTGTGALIAKADDSFADRQYYLFIFQDRVWASIGGEINSGGSIGAADGEWHHAAVVNRDDGGIMRYTIYFDGEQIGMFNAGTTTNDDDVLFGARRDVGNTGLDFLFDGEMDEVMIVGRALTPVEMLGLYADGAGRIIGGLASDGPTIYKTSGNTAADISAFTSFDVLLGPGHQGDVAFQLSTNGLTWQYWDGATWSPALDDTVDRNDETTVAANIGAFDTSADRIFVRGFLLSDGEQQVEIDHLSIGYDGSGLDGTLIVDETVTIDLLPGLDVTCTFSNLIDPEGLVSITLVKEASPADGTDFSFGGDLGGFTLDDALPDDGDLVPDRRNFDDLLPGTYQVSEMLPAGWSLDSFNCDPGPTSDVFEVPFTIPGSYTFDPTLVEVADGVARLLQDPVGVDLVGYWRMEEPSWNGTPGEVTDSTGNGLDGTRQGDANTLGLGKIGRTGTFDGSGDLVNLGQPSALNFNPVVDEFSITLWYKSPSAGALVSKADADFGLRQFYIFVSGDRLWGAVGGSQNEGLMLGAMDDEWHHAALVNYDDAGTMRYRLYFDGQLNGEFPSGTATNASDVMFGARRNIGNTGSAFALPGEIDEVAIVGRALGPAEIDGLYNAGAGRIIREYPTGGVPIVETAGDGGVGLVGLTDFQAFFGPGNLGTAEFQLSDDGITWQYWNGVAWTLAASEASRNDAATVAANIAAFDVSADALFVRTFLVSDGDQTVEVDLLTIDYDALSDVPVFNVIGTTATLEVDPGDDVICTFVNLEDMPMDGTVTLNLEGDPRFGRDFSFDGDFGPFTLDDAAIDDGDGFGSSIVFPGLAAGTYMVDSLPVGGWAMVDFRCATADGADTSGFDGSTATLDLDAGESLSCTFVVAPLLTQLTRTTGSFGDHRLVATNGDGTVASFASTRDPLGTNADGGEEIFVRTRLGFEQITDTLLPTAVGRSALSQDGRFVVFESAGDPLGTNADGNREIFRHDRLIDSTVQLTFTMAPCENRDPSVDETGSRVAFVSDCADLDPGFNADGNAEVVVWESGGLVYEETVGCTSLEPEIAPGAGDFVSFHSNCDAPYTAGNPDANQEIFQWQWGLGAAGFTQVTTTSGAASELAETVSSSHDGAFLLFSSNADLAGSNGDGSVELFRWDRVGGSFLQLTDAGITVVHSHGALGDGGRHAAYERLDLVGGFVSNLRHVDTADGTDRNVASGATTDEEFPAVAVTGIGRVIVYFQSAANFLGQNADGNVELWRSVVIPLVP